MTISERNDALNARENAAGGPQHIIAGLTHDARWQKVYMSITVAVLVFSIGMSVVIAFAVQRLNTQQNEQNRSAHQMATNQAAITGNQKQINDAAKTKALFDWNVCTRSHDNITELIRLDTVLGTYLGSIRPTNPTLIRLATIYKHVHLTAATCGSRP